MNDRLFATMLADPVNPHAVLVKIKGFKAEAPDGPDFLIVEAAFEYGFLGVDAYFLEKPVQPGPVTILDDVINDNANHDYFNPSGS